MIRRLLVLAPLATFALTSHAAAQGSPLIGEETIEITAFAGLRTGGGFSLIDGGAGFEIESALSYGGLLDFNLRNDNFKLELLYSRQESHVEAEALLGPGLGDIAIEYYQAGVLQEVGRPGARWYVAVLLGATRLAPRALDSETFFSASIGGGLKLFPSERVGIRFDARAYATFVSSSTGAFCANGRCVFAYSGSTLWQGDFTGGLVLAF